MTENEALEPPLPEVLALAAISAVPLVGSPLAQLIGGYRTAVQGQRLTRFAESLATRLNELEFQQRLDREFAESENYALYVLRAAESAAASHREDRIALLARVAGSGAQVDTSDLWRDKYLSAAESLGQAHIRVLRITSRGEGWLVDRDDIKDAIFLRDSLPEFTPEETEFLLRDLAGLGLASDVGAGRLGVTAGQVWRATQVGERFLDFLAEGA